jgi:hypothetical protein
MNAETRAYTLSRLKRKLRLVGGAERDGEMNELEPKALQSEWLWFGAALLAIMVIAWVMIFPQ